MIKKLEELDIENFPVEDLGAQLLTILAHINGTKRKINEIIDLLNAIVVDVDEIKCIDGSKKAEPDFIMTSYMTDGDTKEYYGQNGARVQFDHPIPAGYFITIKEPIIKGGDNE